MKKRTKQQFNLVLKGLLESYEIKRTVMQLSPEEARAQTIESYDDFGQWVYYEGEFND